MFLFQGPLVFNTVTDAAGNIYVLGKFLPPGAKIFSLSGVPTQVSAPSNLSYHYFLVKYSAQGEILWRHVFKDAVLNNMVANPEGDLFLAAYYDESFILPSTIGNSGFLGDPALGHYEAALFKYNSNGELQWVTSSDDEDGAKTSIRSIAIDEDDRLYLTGHFFFSLFFFPSNDFSIVGWE